MAKWSASWEGERWFFSSSRRSILPGLVASVQTIPRAGVIGWLAQGVSSLAWQPGRAVV